MTTNATTSEDFYGLLGVDPATGAEELRRVWRDLVWQYHPDRAGAHTTATYEQMSQAYAVLSDPTARAAYDHRRAADPKQAAAIPAPPMPLRSAPAVRLSRLSGPLIGLVARGIARWVDSHQIELCLNEVEVALGGMVEISLRVPVRCAKCGAVAAKTCARCEGSGVVEELFSAWLAVRPGVADGTVLQPSAWLPGMLERVYFRVRVSVGAAGEES